MSQSLHLIRAWGLSDRIWAEEVWDTAKLMQSQTYVGSCDLHTTMEGGVEQRLKLSPFEEAPHAVGKRAQE